MNKKFTKTLKLMTVTALAGALAMPVMAMPVDADLNTEMTYIVDGETLETEVSTLVYEEEVYMPVSLLSEMFGHKVSFEGDTLTIDAPQADSLSLGVQLFVDSETSVIEKAVIKDVDLENGRIAVLEDGKEDSPLNYTIIRVNSETLNVRHEVLRIGLTADALVPGYEVSISHSPFMTMSLPPQTEGLEIVILKDQEFPRISTEETIPMTELVPATSVDADSIPMTALVSATPVDADSIPMTALVPATPVDADSIPMTEIAPATPVDADSIPMTEIAPAIQTVSMKGATIKEVNVEENYIMVLPAGLEDTIYNYTRLNVSESTLIRHELNKMAYRLEALEVGMTIDVSHSMMMTMSLPPQTAAIEVVVLRQEATSLETEESIPMIALEASTPVNGETVSMTELEPAIQAVTIENATIKEVNVEDNYVMVLPAGEEDEVYNYIRLSVSEETHILHEMDRRMYRIDSLEEGMTVKVRHSMMSTLSIPPQTPAFQILILRGEQQ